MFARRYDPAITGAREPCAECGRRFGGKVPLYEVGFGKLHMSLCSACIKQFVVTMDLARQSEGILIKVMQARFGVKVETTPEEITEEAALDQAEVLHEALRKTFGLKDDEMFPVNIGGMIGGKLHKVLLEMGFKLQPLDNEMEEAEEVMPG